MIEAACSSDVEPFLCAKEDAVFPLLIPLRQRIALCFHALHDGLVRWIKPRSTSLLLGTIADLAKGKSQLLVENTLLPKPLIILHRVLRASVKYFNQARPHQGIRQQVRQGESPPCHQISVVIASSRFQCEVGSTAKTQEWPELHRREAEIPEESAFQAPPCSFLACKCLPSCHLPPQ